MKGGDIVQAYQNIFLPQKPGRKSFPAAAPGPRPFLNSSGPDRDKSPVQIRHGLAHAGTRGKGCRRGGAWRARHPGFQVQGRQIFAAQRPVHAGVEAPRLRLRSLRNTHVSGADSA